MEFDILAIEEYTDEYDVLKHAKPEIKTVYSALKAFTENKENWEWYPEYSVLKMLNDICRIDRHSEEHPNECIDFIEKGYTDSPVNQLFLALIGVYITNPVFLLMLANQPSIKAITNSQEQTEIRKEIEAVSKDLSYELELSTPIEKKLKFEATEQSKKYNFDIEKITDVYNFCIETKVINKDTISNVDFINAVYNADFKEIHDHAVQQKSKSKCKYIIFVISKFVSPKWYLNTAHGINTEPNKCSGIGVPMGWKKKADEIK